MNPISFNYNSLANIDDGSCIGVVLGCMDDGIVIDYDGDGLPALNYNPLANTDDGSCLYYDINTVTGAGVPYWLNDSCYAWVVYEVDPYCLNNQWDAFCQNQYDYCENGTPLSIEDLTRNQVVVYPNPTRGIITIAAQENVDVNVYDMLGNLIIYKKEAKEVDISKYPQGIYDLRITYRGMIINHRVIKQ